jgi:hypothetical protein
MGIAGEDADPIGLPKIRKMPMPVVWTSEQVTSMAPDGASVAAGRKQAGARKWQSLGHSDQLLWGEIKGSGANPYQVCIELAGPAFKCSCPSHKFPCKHALGLAYVYAEETAAIIAGEPPEWARAWFEGRAERAQKRAERAAKSAEPEDPDAAAKREATQQKRAASRWDKVAAGIDDLECWLRDLMRQGLAANAAQPYSFWDQISARMIDAQAPGLARLTRKLGELRYGGSDWQSRLLDQIARIHLLLSAYHQIDSLESPLQAEIRTLIGFPQEKEALLAQEGLHDHWLVLASWIGQEEELRLRRTWLRGTQSGRYALLIDFAVHDQPFPPIPPPGSLWQAELVFYPGTLPMRALVKQELGIADHVSAATAGSRSFTEAYRNCSDSLVQDPWIELFPFTLEMVTPEVVEGRWFLRDNDNAWLPLTERFESAWNMLAVSGGEPLTVFGEWDGCEFLPLTIFPASELARPLLQAA